MYIAIAVAISLLIFVIVRATGVTPSRKLFNIVLGAITVACLVSLARLWPTYPIAVVEASFVLGAGTVVLLLKKDNEGRSYFAAVPRVAFLWVLKLADIERMQKEGISVSER